MNSVTTDSCRRGAVATHAHALPSGDGAQRAQRAQSAHGAKRRDVVRAGHHRAVVYERQLIRHRHPNTNTSINMKGTD